MVRRGWLAKLLFVPTALIILAGRLVPARADVAIDFDNNGLSKLDWSQGPQPLLTSGRVELADLKVGGADATGSDFTVTSSKWDPAGHTLIQQYPWGTVRIGYRPEASKDGVQIAVAVQAGPRAITRLQLYLLRWKLPNKPSNSWNGADILLHDRDDDFPIVTAHWGSGEGGIDQGPTGQLAICDVDLANPIIFGDQPLNKGEQAVLIRVNEKKPILPGSTRRTTLSVRVAPADAPPETFLADVLQAYAARYPAELNWPDRRPIGSAFLATSVAGYQHNPRGWLQDSSIDVTTPAGLADFDRKIAQYADDTIAHCRKLNAQGVIVWDVEGQEMPHATSYLADPRMLSQVAPEMDAMADGLFRKFTGAGLRVGVTIRPTRVTKADTGPGWQQTDVADPIAEMDAKISYAQKRWGCTLFYLDSNVFYEKDGNGKLSDVTMPVTGFRTLAEHHKDCLIMPEHKTSRYWAYTAPYCEFKQKFMGTPAEIHIAYPHAFSVMQVVDGPSLSDPVSVKTLTSAINQGDILLFRPWWDDPQTIDIEHLYAAAHIESR